jgi:hypothetical protein
MPDDGLEVQVSSQRDDDRPAPTPLGGSQSKTRLRFNPEAAGLI